MPAPRKFDEEPRARPVERTGTGSLITRGSRNCRRGRIGAARHQPGHDAEPDRARGGHAGKGPGVTSEASGSRRRCARRTPGESRRLGRQHGPLAAIEAFDLLGDCEALLSDGAVGDARVDHGYGLGLVAQQRNDRFQFSCRGSWLGWRGCDGAGGGARAPCRRPWRRVGRHG